MSDLTGLWVFAKRHGTKISLLIAGLLIFIAGWQTGRVMSPYYAASSIVFQDDPQAACVSLGGSPEALAQLRQEGQGIVAQAITVSPSPLLDPTVVASPTSAPVTGAKTFVGSKNSNLYHDPSCATAKRIKEENQVWFATREEAEKAGYTPSACTKEKLGI